MSIGDRDFFKIYILFSLLFPADKREQHNNARSRCAFYALV